VQPRDATPRELDVLVGLAERGIRELIAQQRRSLELG